VARYVDYFGFPSLSENQTATCIDPPSLVSIDEANENHREKECKLLPETGGSVCKALGGNLLTSRPCLLLIFFYKI